MERLEINECKYTKADIGSEEDSDTEENGETESLEKRTTWGGQFEFLLSLIGFTVGLGNIWRFPYIVYRNGGGVFFIPFTLFLTLCGGPLYYLEVCLGQFSGKSPITVWSICPLFKGIGPLMAMVSLVCLWYFGVVFAWVLYFLIQSFYPELGWATCNNEWNSIRCIGQYGKYEWSNDTEIAAPTNFTATYVSLNSSSNTADSYYISSGTEFWRYNVLNLSSGIDNMGSVQWHLVGCLFLGWLGTFLCVVKGVKSLGKVVYITATAPYLLLLVLLIRGATLDGAWDGVRMYITADFSRLTKGQIWMEAAIQVFYSLGPAWGTVITMASFNKFHHPALRDTIIVCVADAFTAILGGFVVFSVLGFLAKQTGRSVDQFASSGPSLAFIAYPEALSRLPLPQFWSVLFFVTLVFIGIDSQFGQFETVANAIIDVNYKKFDRYRVLVNAVIAVLLFLAGIPLTFSGGYYIFLLADWYIATFNLVITGVLEAVIVAWIYGASRFSDDIEMMQGSRPSIVLRILWCFVIPAFLMTITIMTMRSYAPPSYGKDGYVFPMFAIVIGNMFAVAPLCTVLLIAIIQFLRQDGNVLMKLKKVLTPDASWGPNDVKWRNICRQRPYQYKTSLVQRFLVNILGLKRS